MRAPIAESDTNPSPERPNTNTTTLMLVYIQHTSQGRTQGRGGRVRAPSLAVVGPLRAVEPPRVASPRGEGSRETAFAYAKERVLGPNKTLQAPAGGPWSDYDPRSRANGAFWRHGAPWS